MGHNLYCKELRLQCPRLVTTAYSDSFWSQKRPCRMKIIGYCDNLLQWHFCQSPPVPLQPKLSVCLILVAIEKPLTLHPKRPYTRGSYKRTALLYSAAIQASYGWKVKMQGTILNNSGFIPCVSLNTLTYNVGHPGGTLGCGRWLGRKLCQTLIRLGAILREWRKGRD